MAIPTYASSLISTIGRVVQNSAVPSFVMGGRSESTYKLFKKDDSYNFNLWRSPVYRIGRDFDVLKVMFNIVGGVTTGQAIIPVLYFDNESSSSVGTTINTTNYSNTEELIVLTSKNFSNTVHGKTNFFLELQFTGSALGVVKLPIEIDIEVEN